MNLLEHLERPTKAAPEHVAVVEGSSLELTYRDLFDQVATVAGGLKELGVGRGDRVVIFSENCAEYLIASLAAARLGAIAATAHATFRAAELGFILSNARPRCAIVQDRLLDILQAITDAGSEAPSALVTIDTAPKETAGPRFGRLPDAPPIYVNEPVDETAGALISYTSGTTSNPKPVLHSHRSLREIAKAYVRLWQIVPQDRVLVGVPMAWIFGLATLSFTTLAAGATVVVEPRFDPARALEDIEENNVTVLPGVTRIFEKILDVVGPRSVENTLRLCITGGEPQQAEVLRRFRERFGIGLQEVYATSECTPICGYDPSDTYRLGSCGRLVDGVEARIVDESGQPVKRGQVGELLVRGPGMMLGYFENPELTASVMRDGWYRTKDYFKVGPGGYFYIAGRASDVIIRGGANISPLEVEAVLVDHPAIDECAVIGRADPSYGERVCAFVVLNPGSHVDQDGLKTYCTERLARFKVPEIFEFVDALPRGTTGKILKNVLRNQS